MQTNLDVANSALLDINVEPLMTFDDPVKAARVVKAKFQGVLDEVMGTNPWNCNRELGILNPAQVRNYFGWNHAFQIPNECLYVRAVVPFNDITDITPETVKRFSEYSMTPTMNQTYMKLGSTVYTNAKEILLIYSKAIKDCTLLPSYVVKAIVKCLAAEIAYPLTQDRQIRADQLNMYTMALRTARAANALEETVQVPISSLITVREI